MSGFQANLIQTKKREGLPVSEDSATSVENSYKVVFVKINDIKLFRRVRPLNRKKIKQLAVAIEDHGLKEPIHLFKYHDGYGIASGHHRYEATKLLGWSAIPAFIIAKDQAEAALWSLNLHRSDLGILERSEAIVGYIEARSKLPAAGKSPPRGGRQPHDKGYSKIAATLAFSRKIVAEAHRHVALPNAIKKTIKKTPHLNKRSILNQLCDMSSDTERQKFIEACSSTSRKRKKEDKSIKGHKASRRKKPVTEAKRSRTLFILRVALLLRKWKRSDVKRCFDRMGNEVRKEFVRRTILSAIA
jgi:ParB family transcriptional regulator, chromosome partitioning protein